ncbi:MAG: cell division protein FtsB [Spongiibacteraceae bacterium]
MRWILTVLLLILIGLQYRLWIGQGSWEQIVSLEREIEQQQAINERLKSRNKRLDNEVRDLKNGLESVEERARTELGLIKQGETFYLLIDKKKK